MNKLNFLGLLADRDAASEGQLRGLHGIGSA